MFYNIYQVNFDIVFIMQNPKFKRDFEQANILNASRGCMNSFQKFRHTGHWPLWTFFIAE